MRSMHYNGWSEHLPRGNREAASPQMSFGEEARNERRILISEITEGVGEREKKRGGEKGGE